MARRERCHFRGGSCRQQCDRFKRCSCIWSRGDRTKRWSIFIRITWSTMLCNWQVPGTEGKAGMVAIYDPEYTLNIKEMADGVKKSLPSYARPLFVRVLSELPMTGKYFNYNWNTIDCSRSLGTVDWNSSLLSQARLNWRRKIFKKMDSILKR